MLTLNSDVCAYALQRGLKLGSTSAPTTFFAQGISFKADKYPLDLCLPEASSPRDKFFHRASISVHISRPGTAPWTTSTHCCCGGSGGTDEAGDVRPCMFNVNKRALKPNKDRIVDNVRLACERKQARAIEAMFFKQCIEGTRPKVRRLPTRELSSPSLKCHIMTYLQLHNYRPREDPPLTRTLSEHSLSQALCSIMYDGRCKVGVQNNNKTTGPLIGSTTKNIQKQCVTPLSKGSHSSVFEVIICHEPIDTLHIVLINAMAGHLEERAFVTPPSARDKKPK